MQLPCAKISNVIQIDKDCPQTTIGKCVATNFLHFQRPSSSPGSTKADSNGVTTLNRRKEPATGNCHSNPVPKQLSHCIADTKPAMPKKASWRIQFIVLAGTRSAAIELFPSSWFEIVNQGFELLLGFFSSGVKCGSSATISHTNA